LTHYQRLLAAGGVAVISGMPGVGKSALALTLAQQVAARDAIFWHTCQPEEGVDGVIWRLFSPNGGSLSCGNGCNVHSMPMGGGAWRRSHWAP
jgi:hypothetical protein